MILMTKITKIIFSSLTILFLILASLEFLLYCYSKINKINFINDNRTVNLYRVYEEGEIFQTFDNFYLYKKNLKNKRYINYYKLNQNLIKVWDYEFSTNNYGLVQNFNLDSKKRSILFLGDSFTEGQGAKPWLDGLKKDMNGYQIINGGFGGAGPKQFLNLNNYLSNELNIKKRVVLFIGSDIRRSVSKLKNTDCIIDHSKCNKRNNVFGIPHNPNFKIEKFLNQFVFEKKLNTKHKIKFFIRDMYLYQYLRSSINNIRLKNNKNINVNLETFLYLNNKYKDHIIFIKIKDANDIMFKKNSYESKLVDVYFSKNNIQKFDCNMNNDIKLFHEHDFHPNEKGYSVLRTCVKQILNKAL